MVLCTQATQTRKAGGWGTKVPYHYLKDFTNWICQWAGLKQELQPELNSQALI